MSDRLRIIDTDCHQTEHISLWLERLDDRFRKKGPMPTQVGGRLVLFLEGKPLNDQRRYRVDFSPEYAAAFRQGAQRHRRLQASVYSPSARLEDMDEYGVDVQIIHPTLGIQLVGREFEDEELLAACCRVYNDWTRDYCSKDPERLRWTGLLSLQDPQSAIEEARRVARAGAVAFCIRTLPICGRALSHPDHEPVWAEIERLGLPVCFHEASSPYLPSFGDRMNSRTTGRMVFHPFEAMAAMMTLIWDGVLERHPGLSIVHVEADAGWLPFWLQRMDQHYEFAGNAEHPDLRMAPSRYFQRQVVVAARGDDDTLPSTVALVGDDNLVFNTDYPHPDGAFPFGFERFHALPIPESSKRKILWDNAARVFGLEAIDALDEAGARPPGAEGSLPCWSR